jgi:hypothetical protein
MSIKYGKNKTFIFECINGNLEEVEALNETYSYSKKIVTCAFNGACSNGHLEIVKILWGMRILDKIQTDAIDNMYKNKHLNIIKWAAETDIKNTFTNSYKNHVLDILCRNNNLELVELFNENIYDNNETRHIKNDLFSMVCNNNNLELAKYIKDFEKSQNENTYDRVFKKMCSNGNLKFVKWINTIYICSRKNSRDVQSFELALKSRHINIIKWIMIDNSSSHIRKKYFEIFINACKSGDIKYVKYLDKLNNNNNTLLYHIYDDHESVLNCEYKYDPNEMSVAIEFSFINCHSDIGNWLITERNIQPTEANIDKIFKHIVHERNTLSIMKKLYGMFPHIIIQPDYIYNACNNTSVFLWMIDIFIFDSSVLNKAFTICCRDDANIIITKWIYNNHKDILDKSWIIKSFNNSLESDNDVTIKFLLKKYSYLKKEIINDHEIFRNMCYDNYDTALVLEEMIPEYSIGRNDNDGTFEPIIKFKSK